MLEGVRERWLRVEGGCGGSGGTPVVCVCVCVCVRVCVRVCVCEYMEGGYKESSRTPECVEEKVTQLSITRVSDTQLYEQNKLQGNAQLTTVKAPYKCTLTHTHLDCGNVALSQDEQSLYGLQSEGSAHFTRLAILRGQLIQTLKTLINEATMKNSHILPSSVDIQYFNVYIYVIVRSCIVF